MKKAIALVMVIGIMVILALMGWTVVNFMASDLEMSVRLADSQRALNVAEAGLHWALVNASCLAGATLEANHTFFRGQYNVRCNTTGIISTGYVPNRNNPQAIRTVKVTVGMEDFSHCLVAYKNLTFSDVTCTGGLSCLNDTARWNKSFTGDTLAANYYCDADSTPNEAGLDQDVDVVSLPFGLWTAYPLANPVVSTVQRARDIGTSPGYPVITQMYFANATHHIQDWPRGYVDAEALIVSITDPCHGHSCPSVWRDIQVSSGIFTTPNAQWNNNLIRNINGTRSWNATDYRVIDSKRSLDTVRVLNNEGSGTGNVTGSWQVGDRIRVGKCFTSDNDVASQYELWYIRGDAILDTRATSNPAYDINLPNTSLIVEKDIRIIGNNRVTMDSYNDGTYNHPVLATQIGNITSPFSGTGRTFTGLVYSEQGNIAFNGLAGTIVIGNNVDLSGKVALVYNVSEINFAPQAFTPLMGGWSWKEQ